MKKSQLQEIIRKIIKKKLDEATLGATTNPLRASDANSQKSSQIDDTEGMADADVKKLESLKKDQSRLTDLTRKADGAIKKLQEPVMRKVQQIELRKSKVQQKLGSITKEVENLMKKNNKS